MRRRVWLLLVLISLGEWMLWTWPSQGQMAVVDVAAGLQLALSVQQQIELVAQGTRDLAPYIQGAQVAADLSKLVALGTRIMGIAKQLKSRQLGWLELTGFERRPTTLAGLDTWLFQARAWALEGSREASNAVDLLTDAVELVNSALSLLQRVPGLTGSVGGLQSVTSALTSLNGLFAGMQGLVAPFQQALLGQTMIKDVAAQVYRESISVHHMSDWGRMP